MRLESRFAIIFLFVILLLSTTVLSQSRSECTGKYLWWNNALNQCEMAETKACIDAHGEDQHYNANTGSCEPLPHYAQIKACQSRGDEYEYNTNWEKCCKTPITDWGTCELPPAAVQQSQPPTTAPSELCVRCKNVMLGGMNSPDPEFLAQCKAAACYGTGQVTCPSGYHLDNGICCEQNYKAAANAQACVYVGEPQTAKKPTGETSTQKTFTDDELRTKIKELLKKEKGTMTQKELSLLSIYLGEFALRKAGTIPKPTDAEKEGFVLSDLELVQMGLERVRDKLQQLLLEAQGLPPTDNKPVSISLMATLLPPEWFKQLAWYVGKTGQDLGLLGLSQPVGATRQLGDALHDIYTMLLNGLPNKPDTPWKFTTSPFDPKFAPKVKPPYGRGFGSIAEAKSAIQKGTFDPRLNKMLPSESPKVNKALKALRLVDNSLTGLQAAADMNEIDNDPDIPPSTKTATKTLIGGLAGAKIASNGFSATGIGAPIGFIISTTADAASGVVVAAAKTAGILNNNWEKQAGAPSKEDWNGLARNFVGKRMLDPDTGKWFAEEGDQVNFKTVPSKDGTLFVGNDGTGRVYRLTTDKAGWFSSTQKMQILNKEGHWVDAQTKNN